MKTAYDIEVTIGDIDARSAALEAEKGAALAEAAAVESALGVAVADADTKQLTVLERRLGELRAAAARIGAALAILLYRRRDAESELHATTLAEANAKNRQLEAASLAQLTTTLAAADAFAAALDIQRHTTMASESLAAQWRNDLNPAPHYASAAAMPQWIGQLNAWRRDVRTMLEAAAPMA